MLLTLLQKQGPVTKKIFSEALEKAVSASVGELSVSITFTGLSERGWAKVEVTGEDAEIAHEVLTRALGKAWTRLSDIELHSVYPGIIDGFQGGGLAVDVGVEDPNHLDVEVRLSSLRAQLCDGKPLSGRDVADYYCLDPGTRTVVRITRLDRAGGVLEGWLADEEVRRLSDWVNMGLDRIEAIHCTRTQLDSAVRRAGLERDIISVEPLTLTVHSAICKLGTDAVGLIPKLGGVLRGSILKPFLPRKIMARCRRW